MHNSGNAIGTEARFEDNDDVRLVPMTRRERDMMARGCSACAGGCALADVEDDLVDRYDKAARRWTEERLQDEPEKPGSVLVTVTRGRVRERPRLSHPLALNCRYATRLVGQFQ